MANDFTPRIGEFVKELELLVRKNLLDSLRGALEGASAPARRARRAKTPGRPRGSARGISVEDAAAKILAHVRANDGQGIGEIAAATGVPLKVAKKAALQLVASGALKKSGQKRGTKYHAGGGRARPAKAGKRRTRKAARKVVKRASKPKAARKAKKTAKPKRKAPTKLVAVPARKEAKPVLKVAPGASPAEPVAAAE